MAGGERLRIEIGAGTTRGHGPGAPLVAGIICACLSVLGFYVAFVGERLEGGIPWMPEALNQAIGRAFVGGGAMLTGLMAVYALLEAWRLRDTT